MEQVFVHIINVKLSMRSSWLNGRVLILNIFYDTTILKTKVSQQDLKLLHDNTLENRVRLFSVIEVLIVHGNLQEKEV